MKFTLTLVTTLIITCLTSGCSLQAKNIANPAVIAKPSTQSNIELQVAIASLLGQKQVLIAKSAFTKSSSLTIERVPYSSQNGQLINGRVTEKPMLFRLVIRDGQCIVQNAESEEERVLPVTKCHVL